MQDLIKIGLTNESYYGNILWQPLGWGLLNAHCAASWLKDAILPSGNPGE